VPALAGGAFDSAGLAAGARARRMGVTVSAILDAGIGR